MYCPQVTAPVSWLAGAGAGAGAGSPVKEKGMSGSSLNCSLGAGAAWAALPPPAGKLLNRGCCGRWSCKHFVDNNIYNT